MTRNGAYTAVVDRFEENQAVLMLERDGEFVDDVVVSKASLPDDARHVDAVLDVELAGGELRTARYDPEETAERKRGARERFERLSERPPSDETE